MSSTAQERLEKARARKKRYDQSPKGQATKLAAARRRRIAARNGRPSALEVAAERRSILIAEAERLGHVPSIMEVCAMFGIYQRAAVVKRNKALGPFRPLHDLRGGNRGFRIPYPVPPEFRP